MNKKFVFYCSVALVSLASAALCAGLSEDSKDINPDFIIASVEALSEGENADNTGPREETKCTGGGHKMVCKCINENSCTDSSCY